MWANVLICFIPATESRGFPDKGSQDPARMQKGKIKDKYFINTLKYFFLLWALQGGEVGVCAGGWLFQGGKLIA